MAEYECPNCFHNLHNTVGDLLLDGTLTGGDGEGEEVDCPGCNTRLFVTSHIEVDITLLDDDDQEEDDD